MTGKLSLYKPEKKLLSFGFMIAFAILVTISCSKPTDENIGPPYTGPPPPLDGWASWSPDGRYIAYLHNALDNLEGERCGPQSIWMYDTQTGHYGFFVGPGLFPEWSPNSNILAFQFAHEIFFYYPETRSVRQVTNLGEELFTFGWSGDGRYLIYCSTYRGEPGCWVIDTLGNVIRDILPQDSMYHHGGWVDWAPSIDKLIWTIGDCFGLMNILIIDTLGNITDEVITDESEWLSVYSPAWAPDETKFAFHIAFKTHDGQIKGDLRIYSVEGQLYMILSQEAGEADWSPDGSTIVFQKYTWMAPSPNPMLEPDIGRVTLWVSNADGTDMHELLGWPQEGFDSTIFDGGYNWLTDTLQ